MTTRHHHRDADSVGWERRVLASGMLLTHLCAQVILPQVLESHVCLVGTVVSLLRGVTSGGLLWALYPAVFSRMGMSA